MTQGETVDLIVVGAGAAGLATAIFAARAAPRLRIRCLDGATRIGAKILVSGGSRCNVTNRVVGEQDFWGGSSRAVRRVLQAFPAARAADFFREIGVPLHEEEDGKLFPDSNRSRTVLTALLDEAACLNVAIRPGERVAAIARHAGCFAVETTSQGSYAAHAVALATGGRSLPKTGSDGFGYQLAGRLGHGYVDTTPALVPLILDGKGHEGLSGVSHPAVLSVRTPGRRAVRLEGALLWTHFGASGPVVLNASRHWHRARLDGAEVNVLLNVLPGNTFEMAETWLQDEARARPRARVTTALAGRLPAAVADAWAKAAQVDADTPMAHLPREGRRRLAHALVESNLGVRDSRGYGYAEVTAGGVPLDEIDAGTMESTVCPGLYLVGEILDVDGRLGGFNFQWAWSTGWVAGLAIARASGQACR
jgi:hypothetical protein